MASRVLEPDEVREILSELVKRLDARGEEAVIHVIGGAAIALMNPARVATEDIDGYIRLADACDVLAELERDYDLTSGWFNWRAQGSSLPGAQMPDTTSRAIAPRGDFRRLTPGSACRMASTTLGMGSPSLTARPWRRRLMRGQRAHKYAIYLHKCDTVAVCEPLSSSTTRSTDAPSSRPSSGA